MRTLTFGTNLREHELILSGTPRFITLTQGFGTGIDIHT